MLKKFMILIMVMVAITGMVNAGENGYKPKEGDVLLVDFPPPTPPILDIFIESLTQSRITHCGIVKKAGSGKFDVIEAIGPVVTVTPLEDFLPRVNNEYVVLRPNYGMKKRGKIIQDFIDAALVYEGTPYDFAWQLDNGVVYCSEIIAIAWKKASGRDMVEPVQVSTLNYHGWEPILQMMGLELDDLVYPPVQLVDSDDFMIEYVSGFPNGWDFR